MINLIKIHPEQKEALSSLTWELEGKIYRGGLVEYHYFNALYGYKKVEVMTEKGWLGPFLLSN